MSEPQHGDVTVTGPPSRLRPGPGDHHEPQAHVHPGRCPQLGANPARCQPGRRLRLPRLIDRDHIANTVDGLAGYNRRVREPGGFELPNPRRDSRTFGTETGKANFTVTTFRPPESGDADLILQTLRSDDQYNTTIYGHDDRCRGLAGAGEEMSTTTTVNLTTGEDLATYPAPYRRRRGGHEAAKPAIRGLVDVQPVQVTES